MFLEPAEHADVRDPARAAAAEGDADARPRLSRRRVLPEGAPGGHTEGQDERSPAARVARTVY